MKSFLKYGLIAGIVYVIINAIVLTAGIGDTTAGSALSLLSYLVLAHAIYRTALERRNAQNGYLSFGNGLASGMQVSLITALIAAIWHYINVKFLNPEITAKLYDQMEEKLEEQGFSGDDLEKAEGMSRAMISPAGQSIAIIIGILIIGLILSLIIAAIMRKEKTHPFGENNNHDSNYTNNVQD